MKEEIEDVFNNLDLEFDVDIHVQGTFDIKVQVIGYEKNNDIYKLYDAVRSCVDRLESLGHESMDRYRICTGVARSIARYTQPLINIVHSALEVEDVLKGREWQFFGYIIYFEKYRIDEIKKWKEFNINESTKEEWNNLMEIVKDFHDDIEMKFDLGFSRVYQNKGIGGDIWDRDIQLDFIAGENDVKNGGIIKFNKSILSRLEWIVEKGEAKIESLRILLNDQDLSYEKFGSKGMINLHGKSSEDFLNQINDELKSVIVGWWITFSPPLD